MTTAAYLAASTLGPLMLLSASTTTATLGLPLTASSTTPVAPSACRAIERNLGLGARGNGVVVLQDFLRARGFLSASSTGYFGASTRAGVAAFQKYTGLPASGFVGAQTRTRLSMELCGDEEERSTVSEPVSTSTSAAGTSNAVAAVHMNALTPSSGSIGTLVALTGFGFTNDNTIRFGSYGVITHVPVSSSVAVACANDPTCTPGIRQTLIFNVPSILSPACLSASSRCASPSKETTPGVYSVSVENEQGTSNSVTFTVRAL